VSLTSHLDSKASPIGQFLCTRFARTTTLTKGANATLRTAPNIRPPAQPGEPYPYGNIGRAIDYRIRYSFRITPWTDLVAHQGARRIALWADNPAYSQALIEGFMTHLEDAISAMQPVGRRLTMAEEALLGRYCFILGLFEETFRTGSIPEPLYKPLCVQLGNGEMEHRPKGKKPVLPMASAQEQCHAELLALVQDDWAGDIAYMGGSFCERHLTLVSRPANLNPTFVGSPDVGGADADLIVDGCLIDIKASVQPNIQPYWLRQLAGYVLLDYADEHHIHSVGIYMARQGTLLTWPLDEFLAALTGDAHVSLSGLRGEFRALCRS
jgi:hypothetical protein